MKPAFFAFCVLADCALGQTVSGPEIITEEYPIGPPIITDHVPTERPVITNLGHYDPMRPKPGECRSVVPLDQEPPDYATYNRYRRCSL